ncbi:hypothetical protein QBC33DRAFT_561516 [Phialemonium atrogriseum]|uniref:Uncharacterized protein n=1 Tax=Phialemonium atrogriseum TaxID=1093897 RepID=A0AAJ0BXB2_9PEZI|nr:uncharacterized protein QBC33DRAFT_561516 [Phialemonium atrogriseum]KAK1764839.1 hypothetical protein QBC33DRAFT_561516 [Phialemonium atrogriseum]
MPRSGYLNMEAGSAKSRRRSCVFLFLQPVRAAARGVSRWWRPVANKEQELAPQPPQKRYVHVPTHAASSFMQTTTSRGMARANEII